MNTRKKIVKTVYKDEESESEDFSESASDAEIPEDASSDDECGDNSEEDFEESPQSKKRSGGKLRPVIRKQGFAKKLLSRLVQPETNVPEEEDTDALVFSVKDLTAEDKLLPAVLNLSESDSSDDERPIRKASHSAATPEPSTSAAQQHSDCEDEAPSSYTDVWSKNTEDSEEVAKKSFEQLKRHTDMLKQTKTTIQAYQVKRQENDADVTELLALGEKEIKQKTEHMEESGSDMEDWEEVKDSKPISQSGIQLVVDFPSAAAKQSKPIDVEMMMRRKINRVKKEYQVYMHKVHVLCWLGHGNYVNRVLNDQDVMAAAFSLVPSDKSYPKGRVDTAYLIQISKWYRDKMKIQPDKNENKYKPKAPPLKEILLKQIKNKIVTSNKMLCYIFVSMLRALGIQCRVMFNFVTVPIRPPNSELCSLATKHKTQPDNKEKPSSSKSEETKTAAKKTTARKGSAKEKKTKISQLDGNFDSSCPSSTECSDSDEHIMQLDGNDDKCEKAKRMTTRRNLSLRSKESKECLEVTYTSDEGVSPPKRQKKLTLTKENNTGDLKIDKATVKPETKSNLKPKVDSKRKSIKHSEKEESQQTKLSTIKTDSKDNTDEQLNKIKTEKKKDNLDEEKSTSNHRETRKQKSNNTTINKVSKTNKSESIHSKNVTSEPKTKNLNNETKTKNKKENIKSQSETITSKTNKSESIHSKNLTTEPKTKNLNNETKTKNKKENIKSQSETITESKRTRQSNKNSNQSRAKSENVSSEFFPELSTSTNIKQIPKIEVNSKRIETISEINKPLQLRKRGRTSSPGNTKESAPKVTEKSRTRSAPGKAVETSKYFQDSSEAKTKRSAGRNKRQDDDSERLSHRDLVSKSPPKKSKLDVKGDPVRLVNKSIREATGNSKEDSDSKAQREGSSEDFKLKKASPNNRKSIDRRVLSSDDDCTKKKSAIDVWCEVFVEEVEMWTSIELFKPQVHCVELIYSGCTKPACYIVGWDNSNRVKDLTRRYVPAYNTITRKQRAESGWWRVALQPWVGQSNHRDREEDEQLDKIMFDAPLPKVIGEYKNHPLYALKRHLLKFEALYPAEAPPLGFVRGEAVYARECVYTCRSRDTWLKEAKTVKLGEKPYKVVKARPKWDRLSNKIITDIPLEVFGPWQVQDYEPPTAEGGVVPRNAYGNVELFKDCMLPKGTVHIKLPGLNKVAKKLNIDCAPAMTGFDFHGGWTHPVFDGFVVCEEFEQLITDAWVKDQEEMEKRERDKVEARVYGNWKKLIRGLLIRERLQEKYAFEGVNSKTDKKKAKGPRLVVRK